MSVEICDYRHGRLLYLPGDPYMGKFLRERGEYSEEEVTLFAQLLRPEDVVIEVGSNIGCHTIPMSRMCRTVFAFEAQRFLFNMLCGNLALNGIHNVLPAFAAVGGEHGQMAVPAVDYDAEGVNFGGISMLPAHATDNAVILIPLDDMGYMLDHLRLLKADCEGMEYDVLVGAQNLIRKTRPILYLEDDRERQRAGLHRLVHDLGYRMYRHMPPYLTGDPLLVSVNLLCVPGEQEIVVRGLDEIG